jgi:hypothetical protein
MKANHEITHFRSHDALLSTKQYILGTDLDLKFFFSFFWGQRIIKIQMYLNTYILHLSIPQVGPRLGQAWKSRPKIPRPEPDPTFGLRN